MSMETALLSLLPGFNGPIERETIVTLSNDKTVTVVKRPEYNGATWAWSVDGQVFNKDALAENYLKQVVYEKLTGLRVMMRPKYDVPKICGVNGAGCRNETHNSALCGLCPLKDNAEAERDGVKLIYAVDVPNAREV